MANPKKTVKAEPEVDEEALDKTPAPAFTRELTTAEKFYIDSHYESIHVDEIASDLGIPVEVVGARVDGLKNNTTPKESGMFERTLAKKKHGTGGAVVMTAGASEQLDEYYQNVEKKVPHYVFRPRDNKQS